VIPTTARGGTSEIAIATPGITSEMSLRASPYAPANPVAIAAIRSITLGDVRPVICPFDVSGCSSGRIQARKAPMRTTAAAPPSVRAAELQSRRASPMTTASAIPMIGVPSGATIIAPMTVAVELAKMPAVAMMADSRIRIQNLDSLRGTSPRSRNSPSCSSGRVRRTPATRLRSAAGPPAEIPASSAIASSPIRAQLGVATGCSSQSVLQLWTRALRVRGERASLKTSDVPRTRSGLDGSSGHEGSAMGPIFLSYPDPG
jgi:hypothetical protein